MTDKLIVFERDKVRLANRLCGIPIYTSDQIEPGAAVVVDPETIRPKQDDTPQETDKP
jgi:hypothetical protein